MSSSACAGPQPASRLRSSSRRRTARLRPRACCAGSPAPRPGGRRRRSACRWPRARPRSRRAVSRTGRAAPGGCRRSRGRAGPGRHSTPSVRVSSARNTAWNTSPAARAWRYRSGWANADHLPSAPSTRLATSTCQCSNGSPARDVRCRNAAATTPDVVNRCGPDRRRVLAGGGQLGRSGRATPCCANPAAPRSLPVPASRSRPHGLLARLDHRPLHPRVVGHGVQHAAPTSAP